MPSNNRPGSSGSARSFQAAAGQQPPVLPFPPLHLGSFHSLSPDSFNNDSPTFETQPEVDGEPSRGRANSDRLGYDDSASRSIRSRSRSPLSLPIVGTPLSMEGGMELPLSNDKATLHAQPPSPRFNTHQSSLATQAPPISPSRASAREQDMRLRDAAVLPRRRTLVEGPLGSAETRSNAKSNKVSPVDGFEASGPPPPLPTSISTGAVSSFSMVKGRRIGDANLDNIVDLTQHSPTRSTFDRSGLANQPDVGRSPTKRSLPHPPIAPKRSSSHLATQAMGQAPPPRAGSYPLNEVARGDGRERFSSAPGAIPAQYRPNSPTRPLRLNTQQVPSRQSSQQLQTPPLFYPSSASLIPGLNDSGPYPAGPSRTLQPQQAYPQAAEEVCLECLMRDRDMADVDVMGDGVWERTSDSEWRELLALEDDVLDQFRRDEQAETRGEEDARLKQVVGWRGFAWEDGKLPKEFLGARGGELTEERLKAQMAMNISASAHRNQTLQKYLFDQQQLIIELQIQRKQHGYVPAFPQTPAQGNSPAAQYAKFHNQQSRDSYPSYGTNYGGKPTQNLRPQTHFVPSQTQTPATPRQLQPAALQQRHGKGISSPGLLERSPRLDRDGAWDTSEAQADEWRPSPEHSMPLRPFSFAVRANGGGAGSEDRHGKRNILGRWGGSVTSLFGGSQNDSGSMMDMHLGLDADRRMRTSSNQVHSHPRSVSMATPTRPSFFKRNSSGRGSFSGSFATAPSTPPSPGDDQRNSRHIEHRGGRTPVAEPKKKKKGFKGFLQKLGGGGGGSKHSSPKSHASNLAVPTGAGEEEQLSDVGAPLAPPPPLSYLVDRGDRQHNRSGSSSAGSIQSGVTPQMRSVSAPMVNSPSEGSLSLSPASSRFVTATGARRESYASLGRRRSILVDDSDSFRQRDSGVEMLDGKAPGPSRRSSAYGLVPDATEHGQWIETPRGRRVSSYQNGAASLSNSSGTMLASVETPALHPAPNQQVNRYKTLPPLPNGDASGSASPDSFLACFPNGNYTADPGLVTRPQADRRTMSMASSEMDDYGLPPARRARQGGQEHSPRMAQSMYTQSGNNSYASFGGGDMEGGGKRGKAKGRFGLTGLLGGGGKKNRSQRGSAELSDAVASSPRSQTSFYR